MKRFLSAALAFVLIILQAGCGEVQQTANRVANDQNTVQQVLQEQMQKADEQLQSSGNDSPAQTEPVRQSGIADGAPKPEVQADENTVMSRIEGIDIDLTSLSSTMVYSEVYNMMSAPADYLGKTIKMDGFFSYQYNSKSDKYYFACIIKDALSCCAQGIEFDLAGEHVFPDDYPELGAMVTVVGVFDTYVENGYVYCTLHDAYYP